MRRLPPKCKGGKVCCVHVTKRKVHYSKGAATRGKKNLVWRKPQKQKKMKGLSALAIIQNGKPSTRTA